jgi:hypothetical protein
MDPEPLTRTKRIVFHCVARLFVSYHYIESPIFGKI